MLQASTARLVGALASVYDQPFQDASVAGMVRFVKDFLAARANNIGCESAPVEVLECLQRVVQGQPASSTGNPEVMADVVLDGCGEIPVPVCLPTLLLPIYVRGYGCPGLCSAS
jgi:hypothetical protein